MVEEIDCAWIKIPHEFFLVELQAPAVLEKFPKFLRKRSKWKHGLY